MLSTQVAIAHDFDVAKARTTLRTLIGLQQWHPVFNVRSTALMTAVGDFILSLKLEEPVQVDVEVITDTDPRGVRIHFTLNVGEQSRNFIPLVHQHLRPVSDQLEIKTENGAVDICTRLDVGAAAKERSAR